MLDGCQARTVFTIVDDVEVKDDTYLYTVKTKYIDVENAPQNIKLKLYCDRKINADYYENVVGVIKYKNLTAMLLVLTARMLIQGMFRRRLNHMQLH